jgi:hypothetical protein
MKFFIIIIYVAIAVLLIAALWKVFTKADQAGWKSIIPIYNLYITLKIVGRPAWWLILFLIPIVNIVIAFVVYIDLARSFGKGTGFGVGLTLLSFIFVPILGFGAARYRGPSVAAAA